MTVKGLEPEIQRLIAKHKSEIKKIKQVHEAELLESDERAAQRYVKMTEELRDQLAHEKEAACSRERDLAKQRFVYSSIYNVGTQHTALWNVQNEHARYGTEQKKERKTKEELA